MEGLQSLHTVILGGEAIPAALVRQHRALLPQVRLFNEYGPTETTVFSTIEQFKEDPVGAVPIGKPIHRTECLIVDRNGNPVPRGAYGELLIGGAGVSAGYVGRDDLTKERFTDYEGLGRIYHTGDCVRWDPQERLTFHGRLDAQVQIRGHRVEPQEIVAALEMFSEVSQAAVVAKEEDGDVRLHAYVVPAPNTPIQTHTIKKELRSTLPEPMIPATITELHELPRAPSGKIDARQLPEPEDTPSQTTNHWRHEPYTQTEEQIVQAFCKALDVDSISVHDDFLNEVELRSPRYVYLPISTEISAFKFR